jgi:hypothetical protein
MSLYSEQNINDVIYLSDNEKNVPMTDYEISRVKSRICKALIRVIKSNINMNWAGWKLLDFRNPEVIRIINETTDYIFEHCLRPESIFNTDEGEIGKYDENELWRLCTTYYFEDEFVTDFLDLLYPHLKPYFVEDYMNNLNVKSDIRA